MQAKKLNRSIASRLSAVLLLSVQLVGALPQSTSGSQAAFQAAVPISEPSSSGPRPLVIWHGLGDTALSEGISGFIEDIKTVHPGIFVHSVHIPEGGSLDDERKAGFWGSAEAQAEEGCEQISQIPELADGFDAIGFSQGGLFMRHFAQYCDGPPIKNLITFGTPHLGIAALIPCPTPPTLTCLLAARAARGGIYTSYAQSHLVQAQYFRDPERLELYMERNSFLRDLGAELQGTADGPDGKKQEGGRGLHALENFVPIAFDADKTVSPGESAHFASYSPANKTVLVSMREQDMYTHDWIGLKALDERKALHLERCPGEHMDLGSGDCGMKAVERWVGWKR